MAMITELRDGQTLAACSRGSLSCPIRRFAAAFPVGYDYARMVARLRSRRFGIVRRRALTKRPGVPSGFSQQLVGAATHDATCWQPQA